MNMSKEEAIELLSSNEFNDSLNYLADSDVIEAINIATASLTGKYLVHCQDCMNYKTDNCPMYRIGKYKPHASDYCSLGMTQGQLIILQLGERIK